MDAGGQQCVEKEHEVPAKQAVDTAPRDLENANTPHGHRKDPTVSDRLSSKPAHSGVCVFQSVFRSDLRFVLPSLRSVRAGSRLDSCPFSVDIPGSPCGCTVHTSCAHNPPRPPPMLFQNGFAAFLASLTLVSGSINSFQLTGAITFPVPSLLAITTPNSFFAVLR